MFLRNVRFSPNYTTILFIVTAENFKTTPLNLGLKDLYFAGATEVRVQPYASRCEISGG
jgi:hypothetical protein